MKENQEELFIFIADMSGYTNFMLSNQTAYTHGVLVITELMQTLVNQIGLPLQISKLEGDAVFFYLLNRDITDEMKKEPFLLGNKLLQLILVFSRKVAEMQTSTACTCGGCKNIEQLKLKIIAHFGKASIVSIGQFNELSGIDVIVAHRLLKNHVEGHRYILLTEQAAQHILLPKEARITHQSEIVPDLGTIPISICFPSEENVASVQPRKSWLRDLKSHFKLLVGTSLLKYGLKKLGSFRNLPAPPS